MFAVINDSLAIGSITDLTEINNIQKQGYQSLIDLCPTAEGNQLNAVDIEAQGLKYASVPVSAMNLNQGTLQTFCDTIDAAQKPIYVRCASGVRAAVMSLLMLADQEKWTEEQYLERRDALGIQHKPNCPIEAFAHQHFANRQN